MPARQIRSATVLALVTMAAGALVTPAVAGSAADRHFPTRQAIDAAVREGAPGVVVEARDRHGRWSGTAGAGDLRSGRERSPKDRYRVGSITKTFVATVLLQLEAEGRLSLDDTVERWLPGVVHGNGHDGSRVTLRQLLNHTSGISSYTRDETFVEQVLRDGFFEHRYDTWTPRQLVGLALRHPPDFAPGTDWKYSNTNYALAGMTVETVTGHSYAEEIERRILRPLRLHATSVPGTDPRPPRPGSRAYSRLSGDPAAPVHDVSAVNPSMAGAAGEMISDSADLQRFYRTLLKGGLLPPRQLKEMTTTVAMDPRRPGRRYGLGLMRLELSCGIAVWGHRGDVHGSSSQALTTRDALHSLAVNVNGDWSGGDLAVAEAEFCG